MNPSQNPSAQRSKTEITDALFRLMKTNPYHEITVKQIVVESKVARKTFYRNFTSKDDVLDAFIDNIMLQYTRQLQMTKNLQFASLLDIKFSFCMKNKELLLLMRDQGLMYILLEKWNTFIPMIHDKVISEDNPIFQSLTPKQISYVIALNVGGAWNIIQRWIEDDMEETPENIKKTILLYVNNLYRAENSST